MKPETAGMSSARLARLARLDEVMKCRHADSGCLPDLVIYVYRNGHLVHTGIFGALDIECGKKMREDAISRICSMSTPIAAVACCRPAAAIETPPVVHYARPAPA